MCGFRLRPPVGREVLLLIPLCVEFTASHGFDEVPVAVRGVMVKIRRRVSVCETEKERKGRDRERKRESEADVDTLTLQHSYISIIRTTRSFTSCID